MLDETLRQKKILIRNDLYKIKNNLNKTLEEYDKLFSLTKEGIIIDNEVDSYNIFLDIKNNLSAIDRNLNNNIIPKINNNI